MNILIISQYYFPEKFRINEIVNFLSKIPGNKLTVLTGQPNYPQGIIYDGFENKFNKTTISNIELVRLPIVPRGKKNNPINLALNYLSFMIRASIYLKKNDDVFDIIYIYGVSPLTQLFPAIKYQKNKSKIILNLYDLWPLTLKHRNIFLYFIIKKIIISWYKKCDLIICTSQGFIDYLLKNNIPSNKLVYLPQAIDHLQENGNSNLNFDNFQKLFNSKVYFIIGNIGKVQNNLQVVKVFSHLGDEFKLAFFGDGSSKSKLKKFVTKNYLSNKVFFYPYTPIEELLLLSKEINLQGLILSFIQNEHLNLTIPARFQSYLLFEKPIISFSSGEVSKMVKLNSLGFVNESNKITDLVKTIIECGKLDITEMLKYQNSIKEFSKQFKKDIIYNKLYSYFF